MMKVYPVPSDVFEKILAPYLGARPWGEVAPIMDALRVLQPCEQPIPPAGDQDEKGE